MRSFLQSAMSRPHVLFAAALAMPAAMLFSQAAQAAQWKWLDAQGVVHYSDIPPPASVPARSILQRPTQTVMPTPAAASTSSPPSAPTSAKQQQAASELEKKIAEKKVADQAAQEQAKLQQQQAQALQNQQNCLQAQKQLQILDSGQRMAQIDAQGQRVIMDDAQRAAEHARIAGLIAQYCR